MNKVEIAEAVPCHKPEAIEARSQPTPHRSNQSDNAAPSSTPPPSCSSSADWPEPLDFRNRLLGNFDDK